MTENESPGRLTSVHPVSGQYKLYCPLESRMLKMKLTRVIGEPDLERREGGGLLVPVNQTYRRSQLTGVQSIFPCDLGSPQNFDRHFRTFSNIFGLLQHYGQYFPMIESKVLNISILLTLWSIVPHH